jgi:hypothetical protein
MTGTFFDKLRMSGEIKSLSISLYEREKYFDRSGSLRGAQPPLEKLYSLSLDGRGSA